MIAAGPFVNIVLALRDLLHPRGRLRARRRADERRSAQVERRPRRPAASSQPGDQLVSIDGSTSRALEGDQLIDTRPRPGRRRTSARATPTDGCEATTPAALVVERDGEAMTLEITPVYDVPRCGAGCRLEPRCSIGFGYEPSASASRRRRRRLRRRPHLADHDRRRPTSSPGSSTPRQREQITGVVGATEVTRQSFEFDTRQALGVLARDQPLARPRQPAPVPAARRRPHLLEPRREGPRQAGPRCGSWSARASSASCSC